MAYTEVMSEGAYYLATAADKIYLNPEGEMEFNGMTIEVSFFKRLFDKLEIKPQVFRVGEFKSAVEPFLLEKMSDANKLQLTELANSIYDHMLVGISEERGVSKERLEEISDKMLVRNASLAKEFNLIDSLLYQDEFETSLKNRLNISASSKINFITYGKYRKSFSNYKTSKNEIAVIIAEGTIMPGSGDQSEQLVGADTYVEEIRKARENKNIKAIIINYELIFFENDLKLIRI